MNMYDLSHVITPEKEEYPLSLKTQSVPELFSQYKTLADDWYIMQELTMNVHVGTHIESPFHHDKNGKTILDIEVRQLINRLVCVDVSDIKPGQCIERALLEKRVEGQTLEGRVLFLYTGRAAFYRDQAQAHQRPYLSTEAVQWIVDRRIVCLGVDSTGIEIQNAVGQPNHKRLFAAGIPLVENLVGLERVLDGKAYYVFILPLPVVGMESSPLRVIAMDREYLLALIDGK